MEKHKVILGAFYIIFGACCIAGSMFVVGVLVLTGFPENSQTFVDSLKIIFVAALSLLFFVSIAGIAGGIGLLNNTGWARNLVLIVSFFYLFFLPLGTILSMYTILVMFRNQVSELFATSLSSREETVNYSGMKALKN